MKTEKKDLENCQVELTVTLDAAETSKTIKEVEKVFLREASLPGFRKGKVPLELIRREFASGLKQEVSRALLHDYYAEAVKAESLDVVNLLGLKACDYTLEGGSFTAVVEVKPTFKLPTYKGLKLGANDTAVSQEDVDKQVAQLRTAFAKYETVTGEDQKVEQGDFVQIDYAGTVGGKPIAEINPEAKFVSEGKGFWVQLEEGRFLPEILDVLPKMKLGETKEGIKAKFDKNSAPEGLKGEKAVYTVTLTGLRKRILPTDEEFAKQMKSESIEKLVASVRETMEKNAVEQEAARREAAAIDLLLKKADFAVPESQVESSANGFLERYAEQAQRSGLDAGYFKDHAEEIRKEALESATKQVRLWYILDAIATAEKLEAKEGERGKTAIEFVLANAKK